MASSPPKVLISYSHDSPEHAERALELANRLREDGVDCMIDQYVVVPEEGWPLWMERQIKDSNFVLMICTETYYKRVVGQEQPGKGLGVRWEGNLIYGEIYRAGTMNTKFIPVFFENADPSHVPGPSRDTQYYSVGTKEGYEELYRRLTDQPRVIKPELGKLRSLPPGERKSEGVLGPVSRKSALSNLPQRNPFFTGRERVLAELQAALAAQGRAALSGLGGVGKTQTALEYAHWHLEKYDQALWATADLREALVSGYGKIAGLLKLPESDAKDQTLAVDAVKRWLGSHESWLLILDNADDLGMAREFIPSGKNGHVLLTTRARATGAVARLVEIQEMGTEEGALFLLRRAKYITEDALIEAASPADQGEAKAIAAQFDGLPLALDQAGAYIEETGCGLSGYLDLYRSRAAELLRCRGALTSHHPDPVATTWALSFEKIEKANPAAAELLRFCAFLHPDQIPEEVFSQGASELGPVLGAVGSDTFALNSSISEMLKYSLLRRDPNTRILEIHRLVQTVLKQAMDEATQRLWAERAVRVMNRAFPRPEFSAWAVCQRLLPQAQACVELINQWSFGFSEAARLLNDAGAYLYERGRHTDAKPLCERALAIREKALGPEHPAVALSLNNLATFYNAQDQFEKAEPLYQRALAIREKVLGPEHPDVAQSLNNLAELYRAQSRFDEAEPLSERALAIRKKALSPEHPDVAQSLNNLALLYYGQSQYEKAEPLYERALAIREKALGPEHPAVALSLNNLALLYYSQCQYEKAEPLYERALAIREKALGPEHPDVAQSLNNLAALYRAQGQYAKAESLDQRTLTIWEKALGPEHPNVAISLNNLALLYRAQGQYAKAEPLYERALVIWEKALGLEHSRVATCLENVAVLYVDQGKYEKAEPLYGRALAIREKALGPEHPDVAQRVNNLATLYHTQGQYAKAEPLYNRALTIWEKALGPERPEVAQSLNNLALLYYNQGQYEKAEPLYQRALAIAEKALGPEHPNVATSLNGLAQLYRAQGQYAKAEPLYQRALAISEKALGPERPSVARYLERYLENYAVLLRAMNRPEEAVRLEARARAIEAKRVFEKLPSVLPSVLKER